MKTVNNHGGLTRQELNRLLDYDLKTGLFKWRARASSRRPAGSVAGFTLKSGYVLIGVNQRHYLAHRLAWFYVTGEWPIGTIDHRDRNKGHNAFHNLREATGFEQNGNTPKRHGSRSGFRGVYWIDNGRNLTRRWAARIQRNGVVTYLGYFHCPREAAKAREAAAMKLFGAFYSGDPALLGDPAGNSAARSNPV